MTEVPFEERKCFQPRDDCMNVSMTSALAQTATGNKAATRAFPWCWRSCALDAVVDVVGVVALLACLLV